VTADFRGEGPFDECWFHGLDVETWAREGLVDYLILHIASRRGKKRALVAVAHSILIAVYHILSRGETYRELGADYFDRINSRTLQRRLVRRLENLGYKVSLEPLNKAA